MPLGMGRSGSPPWLPREPMSSEDWERPLESWKKFGEASLFQLVSAAGLLLQATFWSSEVLL